jgi:hypothetical protein
MEYKIESNNKNKTGIPLSKNSAENQRKENDDDDDDLENSINMDQPYWNDSKDPPLITSTLFSILNPFSKKFVKFDEKINDLFDKPTVSKESEDKLKKLIIKTIKRENSVGCNVNNDELIVKNSDISPSIKNVSEMNFIKDINLVNKIIRFRKLEIRREILIFNYGIEVYKNLLVKYKFYKWGNPGSTRENDPNLQKIIDDLIKCERYLNNIIHNSNYIKTTLYRYVTLNNSFDKAIEKYRKARQNKTK